MIAGRVLVTGASGFVGRHALPALLARGFEVHSLTRGSLPNAPAQVVQHHGDILGTSRIDTLIERIRPSHLLHLAWTVAPGQFWRAPENLDWVSSSLLLYRAFVRGGGRRVLVSGSCAEYDWTHDVLDEATTPCRPTTLYGAAKNGLHNILAAAAQQDGVALAWGRLFFLYGPCEAPSRLVSDIVGALVRGEPALCGPGTARRDFMHVADVGGGLAATLGSTVQGAINIASGECVTIRSVAEMLADQFGRSDLLRIGARPAPDDEPQCLAASVGRLRDEVGFTPRFSLAGGLADTIDWWRKQPHYHVGLPN